MSRAAQNNLAAQFRALHQPGQPLILGNVYDASTASIIASLSSSKAIATASFAIAATQGVYDDDMTKDQNLSRIAQIAAVVIPTGKPLTADLQDGYTDIKDTIRRVIELGVVGANIEDVDSQKRQLRTLEDSVSRIQQAVAAASEAGVPNFAINARTDVLGYGGTVEQAIERGLAFLNAGANTVFVWGGPKGRGVSSQEIKLLVKAFDGKLNVIHKIKMEGFLSIPQIRELGVARVSVGPGLYLQAMNAYKKAAEDLLGA